MAGQIFKHPQIGVEQVRRVFGVAVSGLYRGVDNRIKLVRFKIVIHGLCISQVKFAAARSGNILLLGQKTLPYVLTYKPVPPGQQKLFFHMLFMLGNKLVNKTRSFIQFLFP